MICPFCETENRDEREKCYHCDSDLSMLRLVVNKAKQHYNLGLEHAERQRYEQAIAEMQNTIELNHDFAPAHVVLGTIYAKLERYDEARRQWEKALSLDSDCNKAYQYLRKLEAVRESLPTVRRLWLMVWSMTIVIVLLGVFLAMTLRASPDAGRLRKAFEAYSQQNLAVAQEQFAALKDSPSWIISETAAQWLEIIQQQIETDMKIINHFIADGDWKAAQNEIARLKQKNLPGRDHERLRGVSETVREFALKVWADELADVNAGRRSRADLRDLAHRIVELYPTDPRADEARRLLSEIEAAPAIPGEAGYDEIVAAYKADKNVEKALGALEQFLKRHPDHVDARELMASILSTRIEVVARACQDAIAQGRMAEAGQLMGELRALAGRDPSGKGAKSVADIGATYARALRESEATRLKKADLKAYAADENFFTLPEDVTGADRRYLEALAEEARQRIAWQAAEWMSKLDYRYQLLTITPEQALDTIRLAPLVLSHYPGRWVYPKTYFYQGAAHLRLDEYEKAEAAFARLLQQYPSSTYASLVPDVRQRAAIANKQRAQR